MPEKQSTRQEHSLDVTPVHHKAPYMNAHAGTPRGNLECPINLRICFWKVKGNLRTLRKPTPTWKEYAKLHAESKRSSKAMRHHYYLCTTATTDQKVTYILT